MTDTILLHELVSHAAHRTPDALALTDGKKSLSYAALQAAVSGFANGLPIAVSVVGRPFAENTVLALGIAFQKATNWHTRRPPV